MLPAFVRATFSARISLPPPFSSSCKVMYTFHGTVWSPPSGSFPGPPLPCPSYANSRAHTLARCAVTSHKGVETLDCAADRPERKVPIRKGTEGVQSWRDEFWGGGWKQNPGTLRREVDLSLGRTLVQRWQWGILGRAWTLEVSGPVPESLRAGVLSSRTPSWETPGSVQRNGLVWPTSYEQIGRCP